MVELELGLWTRNLFDLLPFLVLTKSIYFWFLCAARGPVEYQSSLCWSRVPLPSDGLAVVAAAGRESRRHLTVSQSSLCWSRVPSPSDSLAVALLPQVRSHLTVSYLLHSASFSCGSRFRTGSDINLFSWWISQRVRSFLPYPRLFIRS